MDNRYPGAGVDTPNHLYSFSFAPYDWSMYFALRDELHAYLERRRRPTSACAANIRFDTEVAVAGYDADAQRWAVTVRRADGSDETLHANVVISGVGIFNPLESPTSRASTTSRARSFHTAQWPDDLDLTGKRVAIIGNGASDADRSRDPGRRRRSRSSSARRTGRRRSSSSASRCPTRCASSSQEVPLYRAWYRVRLGWTFNDRIHPALQKDPNWEHPDRSLNAINDGHRDYFTQYIHDRARRPHRPARQGRPRPTRPSASAC